MKRTLNGVTTYYIYDGEKPIIEYNSGGALVGRNLYGKGIDEILHRAYGAQSYYFQQDRNGNVTHLTDISGAIVEQYRYDAFGAVTILAPNGTERAISAYNNRFLFTGREYAATFGFYEYRARAYNPTLGRFMSEDPIGFQIAGQKPSPPASLMFPTQLPKTFQDSEFNLFRYCHNDPINKTDPTGLYGRGLGWDEKQWQDFQQKQAAALQQVQDRLGNMTKESFEKQFGKGTATAENMARKAGELRTMQDAMRDDGSKGYYANAVTRAYMASLPNGNSAANGVTFPPDRKSIYLNVENGFSVNAVKHEAAHNAGLTMSV